MKRKLFVLIGILLVIALAIAASPLVPYILDKYYAMEAGEYTGLPYVPGASDDQAAQTDSEKISLALSSGLGDGISAAGFKKTFTESFYSAGDSSALDSSAGDSSVLDSSAGDSSALDSSAGDSSVLDSSAGDSPVTDTVGSEEAKKPNTTAVVIAAILSTTTVVLCIAVFVTKSRL